MSFLRLEKIRKLLKYRKLLSITLGILAGIPVTMLFLISSPVKPTSAQSTNPWNLYNNPTYGNALDMSLGPSTVDPPPLRLHSNGNMMVRGNIILGPSNSGAINSQTWGSTAKSLLFNSATVPWWIRQNASDTTLAFGSSTTTSDGSINFYINQSGSIFLPKADSTLQFPGISGNTGGYMGIRTTDGNMSDGTPYYGAFGREPGAWVSPFPDYLVGNHTGLRLHAHGGYGGVSIYEQLNPAGNAWSSSGNEIARFRDNRYGASYINTGLTVAGANTMGNGYNGLTQAYGNYIWPGRLDGSGANWQQNWYLGSHSSYGLFTNTGIYISGTSWAPFIYDSQNTAYYIDPNSTSRLNGVTADHVRSVPHDTWIPYPGNNYNYLRGPTFAFNSIWYDENNSGYYIDPASTSQFYVARRTYGFNGPEYDENDGSFMVDPNGTTRLYHTQMSSYNPLSFSYNNYVTNHGTFRLTPNLHINTPSNYGVYVNWDNGVTTTPSNILSFVVGNGNGGHLFYIRGDGYVWTTGQFAAAGVWYTSDARLKKDIAPIQTPLNKILNLNGKTFYWDKANYQSRTLNLPDKRQLGFLAQEVETVLPEVVDVDKDGFKQISYGNLTALLVEGIKELNSNLNDLKQILDKFMNEMNLTLQNLADRMTSSEQTGKIHSEEIKKMQEEIINLKRELDEIKQTQKPPAAQ